MGIYSLNLVTVWRLKDFDNNTSSIYLGAIQALILHIFGSKLFGILSCIVRDLTFSRLFYDLCYLYIKSPTEEY